MPKSAGQKLKLLYILKLLEEESGEQNPVSTSRIISYLEGNGIHSERKSIYDDMEKLREFGYDVIQSSNRTGGGYYLGQREFELAELKLLVDAVQSSRFITAKKSRELISKLEAKAGRQDAGKLQRQVQVLGRVKTENESIYYSIDSIHRAIQENSRISFIYLDWNLKKEMVPRSDKTRTVSPWALVWNNENYYLIAYDTAADAIRHFRVDKMGSVEVTGQAREGQDKYRHLDLSTYTNETFGMFGGTGETVTLDFPDHLVGVVIDRFGKDVSLRKNGNDRFQVRAQVAVSGQFFGWLAGLGREVRILKPESVRQQYYDYLRDLLKNIEE